MSQDPVHFVVQISTFRQAFEGLPVSKRLPGSDDQMIFGIVIIDEPLSGNIARLLQR